MRKSIQQLVVSVLGSFLVATLLPGGSRAELVSGDYAAPGDGGVTIDTLTNLEWIDLTRTTNLSFNDIMSGNGNTWLADGWRYATTSDVCGLFGTYGAIPSPCPRPGYFVAVAPTSTVLALQSLFGVTDVAGTGSRRAGGFFDDGSGNGLIGWASITQSYYELKDGFEVEADDIYLSESGPRWGNFLVRPVPEPSTALALMTGLAMLGIRGRRDRALRH